MRVRLEIQGLSQLRRALLAIGDEGHKAIERQVRRSALKVQAAAKERVAVDQGHLRNSIAVEYADDNTTAVVGTNLVYGPAVEFGSRPHFPPLGALRDWARRNGIPEEAAFPIALKIAREGTRARPFLFPSIEEERPKFIAALRREMGDAFVRVARG